MQYFSFRTDKGWTWMLLFSIISAFLGMVQFGFNTGVINVPEEIIKKFIATSQNATEMDDEKKYNSTVEFIWSIAVSIFAIGGMIGAQIGGLLADKLGRKKGLLSNNFIAVVGGLLMALSKASDSVLMLIFGRLVIGINCGINTVLVPLYLSEIAPVSLRGGLGTVSQLGVTIGLLLSQILGINMILGTENGWPYLLGLSLVPPILQWITLPFCPESPRYLLISQNQETNAIEALKRLRGEKDSVDSEVEEMKKEHLNQMQETKMTIVQLLKSPILRIPLTIGVMMHLSQQLTGINAIFYYSTKLFESANLKGNAPMFATIGVGVVMVVMTFITIPMMDRLGRRTLHLYGLGGMFVFSIALTISLFVKEVVSWFSYVSVISTLAFVMFFAIGPGTIPWMITPELFSQGPRPAAISLVVGVNWIANFTVGLVYPHMQRLLTNSSFIPFTILLLLFWFFTYKMLPETKNKTFEEISSLFRRDKTQTISKISSSDLPPLDDLESCKHQY